MGLTPALGEASIRRTWATVDGRRAPPERHISRAPWEQGFGAGLFPLHSPLLRESLLVSFEDRCAPSASLPAGRTRLDAEGSIAPALLLKTLRSVAADRLHRVRDRNATPGCRGRAVSPRPRRETKPRPHSAQTRDATPFRQDIGAPICARPPKTFRREDLTPSSTRLLGAARWLSLGNDGRALKAPDQRSKGAAGSRCEAGRPGRSWPSARARHLKTDDKRLTREHRRSATLSRRQQACFEHSNFFKVNAPAPRGAQLRGPGRIRREGPGRAVTRLAADRKPGPKIQLRAF
uniref:Uncharacterized protein n=1 Tax=Branchiostoma floridae TaxID=7739 RepID=C3ZN67_BRAFL|eukprot:XP_002590019.1 hypothetical protein BRAFLDRAFT_122937 [Branchiostoma floridae]